MKIALYGKHIDSHNHEDIKLLLQKLNERGVKLQFYEKFMAQLQKYKLGSIEENKLFSNAEELDPETSFLISIGGDGTFLDTILLVRDRHIPVLGINTGHLGFLSNTPTTEIEFAVDCLMNGKYSIDDRSMLQIESETSLFGKDNYALNEISLVKRDSSSMIIIDVRLDGNHLNTYWADGLIISTATGSTAYSLSCGGPILMPGSGNFVITPISPHNLNVRPIVIDYDSVLDITVKGRVEKHLVALDSRSAELDNGEKLQIRKADFKISLIQLEENSFINSLKGKLNWGVDKRNN